MILDRLAAMAAMAESRKYQEGLNINKREEVLECLGRCWWNIGKRSKTMDWMSSE